MAEVRSASREDLPEVAALVGSTFCSDAMLTWTMPAGANPAQATTGFFGTFHHAAIGEGWIWVVGDGRVDGIAMWVPPDPEDRYGRVMKAIDQDVTELMGERKQRYDTFWAWIDEHRPAEPHWYLEHIAVAQAMRGSGLGGALIRHGLSRADADDAHSWLVTSKIGNLPLYERFGFAVDAEGDAPEGGPHLWFMVRPPA